MTAPSPFPGGKGWPPHAANARNDGAFSVRLPFSVPGVARRPVKSASTFADPTCTAASLGCPLINPSRSPSEAANLIGTAL